MGFSLIYQKKYKTLLNICLSWPLTKLRRQHSLQRGQDKHLLPTQKQNMKRKRKPDLMVVLAIVVGFGVIASGLAQGMLNPSDTKAAQLANAGMTSKAFISTRLRP